jgi:hypothetical protein
MTTQKIEEIDIFKRFTNIKYQEHNNTRYIFKANYVPPANEMAEWKEKGGGCITSG